MTNEARQRLGEIAKDPDNYIKLLQGLLLQVGLETTIYVSI